VNFIVGLWQIKRVWKHPPQHAAFPNHETITLNAAE
jgi:hypothetical protein